jgi:type I restriction enzyme S subunit
LPPGWATARLDELFATITDGDHQPPPQALTGVPFVVIGDIRDGVVDLSDARFVQSAYYESLPDQKKPHRGDLLYTVTGSFGIPVVVGSDAPFCVQRHIAILKPDHATNVRYVALALSTNAALRQATAVATGTAQKTVGLARLRAITIPLAPTNQQERIVEALDSLLSRLDAAVASLESAERRLKAYRASVLKAAVEGRLMPTEAELARKDVRSYEPADVLLERILKQRRRYWEESELAKMKTAGKTPKDDRWKAKYSEPEPPDVDNLPGLPEGWYWATLDQISTLVRNGHSTPPKASSGVRTLRISAVRPLAIDFEDVRYLPGRPSEYADDLVEEGDLLFTRYNGTPALVGVCGRVRFLDRETVHPDKLIKVRLLDSTMSAFIEIASNAGLSRRHVESRTRTTAGQAGISGTDLKQMPIPLPPQAEQERIRSTVEGLLTIEGATRRDIESGLRRCAALRQAVLRSAFEGSLVDRDDADESADALLARIQAERKAAAPTATKAKHSRRLKAAS